MATGATIPPAILELSHLVKGFWVKGQWRAVIDGVSLRVPAGQALGLLGCNGAGKTTLLDLIAGNLQPDFGQVARYGTVSFPVGFAAGLHRDLSGAQNIRFLARVYGVDSDALVEFVAAFSELGRQYHDPVRTYSAGMRARLGFGASMGLPFDLYLIDEATAVGDARFREKSKALFRHRVKAAGGIMVSHNMQDMRQFCDAGLVLHGGKLWYFDQIEDAISVHQDLQKQIA